jgi:uncharacterized protein
MFARHFIDSLDFAHKGKELCGEIPVAEMARLGDMLATSEGQVSYMLRGLAGKDGRPMLELSLEGLCHLRCQRCLQAMDYPIRQVSRLLLTEEQATEDELLEEDFDSIPPDANLDVAGLVEDEILLNLPFAPKHDVCMAATEGLKQGGENPFEVLRSLKNE